MSGPEARSVANVRSLGALDVSASQVCQVKDEDLDQIFRNVEKRMSVYSRSDEYIK